MKKMLKISWGNKTDAKYTTYVLKWGQDFKLAEWKKAFNEFWFL